jgi:uncharacterized protein (TIGR00730 family)
MKKESIIKLQKQAKINSIHSMHEFEDYRDTWRVFRIMAELVEGYNFLTTLKREVTVFGSARFDENHEHYKSARKFGGLLAQAGFTTITGGGPGIMEATNRGAFEAGGESVGLNIQLPFEQRINPYVKTSIAFHYFFTRKVMMTSPANAFIYFPGGFGTLDEFFEVVDLMELGMMAKSPIVVVNNDFWEPLVDFLSSKSDMIGSINLDQIEEWRLVDTPENAYQAIKDVKDVSHACDLSPNNFHCEGNIDWKIFRVMAELVEGFEFVTGIQDAVTVLGTKSITVDSPYYGTAYELGSRLAKMEYTVVTGGKFGIAEAANKGAFEQGGTSIGIGMKSGKSAQVNSFLNKSILFDFPFTRKLIVTAPTKAFVFFPGGFGSMHQLFEILTLIQTKKMPRIPVVLFDHDFWQPLNEYIRKVLIQDVGTISEKDDELYQMVDDVDEIVQIIKEAHID